MMNIKQAIMIVAIFLGIFFLWGRAEQPLYGYIEGDFIYIAAGSEPSFVQKIFVKRGQQVQKDQALFKLDLTKLEAEKNIAQAEIQRLQAQYLNAQKEYHRITVLKESGASTDAQYDQAALALLNAQHLLTISEQKLIQVDQKIKDASPVASCDAVVQQVFFEEQEFVKAGQAVLSLLNPQKVKLRFFLPQSQIPSIQQGQEISVRCDGSKKTFPFVIDYISSELEYTPPVIYSVESRSKLVVLVEASAKQYDPVLRPGLPVSVFL